MNDQFRSSNPQGFQGSSMYGVPPYFGFTAPPHMRRYQGHYQNGAQTGDQMRAITDLMRALMCCMAAYGQDPSRLDNPVYSQAANIFMHGLFGGQVRPPMQYVTPGSSWPQSIDPAEAEKFGTGSTFYRCEEIQRLMAAVKNSSRNIVPSGDVVDKLVINAAQLLGATGELCITQAAKSGEITDGLWGSEHDEAVWIKLDIRTLFNARSLSNVNGFIDDAGVMLFGGDRFVSDAYLAFARRTINQDLSTVVGKPMSTAMKPALLGLLQPVLAQALSRPSVEAYSVGFGGDIHAFKLNELVSKQAGFSYELCLAFV